MMNRRYFLERLTSGLVAAVAPNLFLPKLIKPGWQHQKLRWVPEEQQDLLCLHDTALDEAEGTLVCFFNLNFGDSGLSAKNPHGTGVKIRISKPDWP